MPSNDATSGMKNTNAGGSTIGDLLTSREAKVVIETVEAERKVGLDDKASPVSPSHEFGWHSDNHGGESPRSAASAAPKTMLKQPPVLPKFDLSIPTPEQREQERQNRKMFAAQVSSEMYDWVEFLRKLDDLSDEDRSPHFEREQEVVRAINAVLSYEESEFRTPARLAWANALIKTCPIRRGPMTETLERLLKDGFLVVVENSEQKKGVMRIYGRSYALDTELRKNPQAQSILGALDRLVVRTAEHGKGVFQNQLDALRQLVGEAPLTSAEIREGKDGRAILTVPDKIRESDGRFFKGGPILVEVRGGKVCVLDGAGTIQYSARRLGESGMFLGVDQLANEKINLGATRMPPNAFNQMVAIHDMVRRGLAIAEAEEVKAAQKAEYHVRIDAEREEFRARATISDVDFFVGDKAGVAFADFGTKPFFQPKRGENGKIVIDKDDRPETKPIWNVFCLVERREDNRIRVSACPDRLKSFFGGCQDWTSPAEKFEGLDQPLRALLRKCFGEVAYYGEK